MMRTLTISTAVVLSASVAFGATVEIDFDSGTSSGVVGPGEFPTAATGLYEEDDFIVSWDFYNDFIEDAPTLSDFNGFTFLSDFEPDSGVGPYGTELIIEKADGSAFALEGIGVDQTYEGFATFAQFTPVDENGDLDFDKTEDFVGPVLRPSLALTGTKTDGTVVVATAFTGSPENIDEDALFYPNFFGPTEAIISPETLDLMSDLASLKIEVGGDLSDSLATTLALAQFDAPPEIIAAAVACGGESCELDGVGSLSLDMDLIGSRNDTLAVEVAGVTVSADEDLKDVTPAPVPLPASAWMLLAGLGVLGARRLTRRR